MIRKVLGAVRKQRLFPPGETVVVAVSGGADSIALLHVLHELSRTLEVRLVVAHLDHRLRGRASAEDAAFVSDRAAALGLPFHTARRNVRATATKRGVSLEMAARTVRYDFLREVARVVGAARVATGHTADDQAETLLLRMARGAGVRGLAGIAASTDVHGVPVVRPLLGVRRAEIEAFLVRRGVTWREDVSNADTSFLRNRVRHEVLPLIRERLNPRVSEALCRTAGLLADEEAWLESLAADVETQCRQATGTLDGAALAAYPVAARRRVLRRWLAGQGVDVAGVSGDTVLRMDTLLMSGRGSGAVDLPGDVVVHHEHGVLRLVPGSGRVASVGFRCRLHVPGETLLVDQGLRIMVRREPGLRRPPRSHPGALPACASLSAVAVGRKALYVRSWRPGDRMRPLGMRGSRKLQDIFVDAHVPVARRATVPIVACAGEIAWLPGFRVARGWELMQPDDPAIQLDITRL